MNGGRTDWSIIRGTKVIKLSEYEKAACITRGGLRIIISLTLYWARFNWIIDIIIQYLRIEETLTMEVYIMLRHIA